MSYARFGCDGSDVYVYATESGYDLWYGEEELSFKTLDGILATLTELRRRGYTVPQSCFDQLRAEIRTSYAWIRHDFPTFTHWKLDHPGWYVTVGVCDDEERAELTIEAAIISTADLERLLDDVRRLTALRHAKPAAGDANP